MEIQPGWNHPFISEVPYARSTHQNRHRLCVLKRKSDFQQKCVCGCVGVWVNINVGEDTRMFLTLLSSLWLLHTMLDNSHCFHNVTHLKNPLHIRLMSGRGDGGWDAIVKWEKNNYNNRDKQLLKKVKCISATMNIPNIRYLLMYWHQMRVLVVPPAQKHFSFEKSSWSCVWKYIWRDKCSAQCLLCNKSFVYNGGTMKQDGRPSLHYSTAIKISWAMSIG